MKQYARYHFEFKELSMNKDFDDFQDENDHIRQNHYDGLDKGQYCEYFDPNSASYYDLDVFSLDYAKSLFHALGSSAKYKGFNLVGHKCSEGVKLGCTQEEYNQYKMLEEKVNNGYARLGYNLFDDSVGYYIPPELEALSDELDKLSDKCRFGVCEPCSQAEYTAYIEQQINHVNDDPLGLYHKNNQTILDPTTMPSSPVDPSLFVERVKKQLVANKVVISDDMPELLKLMCRVFNFSIHPNSELPRTVKNLVFPAQTGIGKSVSVQVYVSMLEKYSSIIVVAKVEEAIKYCNYINQLSGDEYYARCFYSLTDKNKDDPMRVEANKLKDHRCIIITHNMFQRVNGFEDVETFSNYGNKPRDFVAIDEKLSFYERYELGYKELDKLIGNVEEAIEQSKVLKELTSSHDVLELLKQFKSFLLFKDDKIVNNENSITVRGSLNQSITTELVDAGEEVIHSIYSNKDFVKLVDLKDKNKILNILSSNHVPTQSRKRKVIGVSALDIHNLFRTKLSKVDSLYSDKLDHRFSEYQNQYTSKYVINDSGELSQAELDELAEFENLTDSEMDELLSKIENEIKSGVHAKGLELATYVLRAMLELRVDELIGSLESLGANKNPNYKRNTLNSIHELLAILKYFSTNHFLIYKNNREPVILATENLINKLGVSVVLDATAVVNEYYKLANRFLGHVGFVIAPQIRKYKNLTINKAIGFKQSRAAIYNQKSAEEMQSTAKSYASYVTNELGDNDDILIICHKGFRSALEKQVNDNRVKFTHWGNHVGINDWSHCNKVILIGWPTRNPVDYISTINSSLDSVLLTSRHLDDDLIEKFEITQLADDIIQGLMRSQARVIATADSDCKETSFYLFYDDKDKDKKVLELVESQFPEATLVNWKPNGTPMPKKKGKKNKNADRVIELLMEKSKDHETYLRADVERELNINRSTMTRLVKSEYFKDTLAENGLTFKNKDGKSQQFVLK